MDNAITTGPYTVPNQWSDALFQHPDCSDGISYASRHDSNTLRIALFERGDLAITLASEAVRLIDMAPAVAAVLRLYGKGLEA